MAIGLAALGLPQLSCPTFDPLRSCNVGHIDNSLHAISGYARSACVRPNNRGAFVFPRPFLRPPLIEAALPDGETNLNSVG